MLRRGMSGNEGERKARYSFYNQPLYILAQDSRWITGFLGCSVDYAFDTVIAFGY